MDRVLAGVLLSTVVLHVRALSRHNARCSKGPACTVSPFNSHVLGSFQIISVAELLDCALRWMTVQVKLNSKKKPWWGGS